MNTTLGQMAIEGINELSNEQAVALYNYLEAKDEHNLLKIFKNHYASFVKEKCLEKDFLCELYYAFKYKDYRPVGFIYDDNILNVFIKKELQNFAKNHEDTINELLKFDSPMKLIFDGYVDLVIICLRLFAFGVCTIEFDLKKI